MRFRRSAPCEAFPLAQSETVAVRESPHEPEQRHQSSDNQTSCPLIHRTSVRARRGPPVVFAATFALLTGFRPASRLRDLSLNSCRVDGGDVASAGRRFDHDEAKLCFRRSAACAPFAPAPGASRRTSAVRTESAPARARAASSRSEFRNRWAARVDGETSLHHWLSAALAPLTGHVDVATRTVT